MRVKKILAGMAILVVAVLAYEYHTTVISVLSWTVIVLVSLLTAAWTWLAIYPWFLWRIPPWKEVNGLWLITEIALVTTLVILATILR